MVWWSSQQPAFVVEGAGGTAQALMARGITYAPDFLVNAGGVIQVATSLRASTSLGPNTHRGHLRRDDVGAGASPQTRESRRRRLRITSPRSGWHASAATGSGSRRADPESRDPRQP